MSHVTFVLFCTKVASVADLTIEQAEEFARTHNIPNVYGSFEEMAKDVQINKIGKTKINNA